MNSGQSIHEYLKEVQKTSVEKALHSPTMIDPSFSISKVIGMMSETDSYDIYCMKDGEVLTTNAREMLGVRDISTTKASSLLHRIRSLSNTIININNQSSFFIINKTYFHISK